LFIVMSAEELGFRQFLCCVVLHLMTNWTGPEVNRQRCQGRRTADVEFAETMHRTVLGEAPCAIGPVLRMPPIFVSNRPDNDNENSAQRDANTARWL